MARTTESSATWAGVSSGCEQQPFLVILLPVLVWERGMRTRRGHS